MRYDCGHAGCDICGARICDRGSLGLAQYGVLKKILACTDCVARAVRFTLSACEQFGGTIIDSAKPCGKKDAHDHRSPSPYHR